VIYAFIVERCAHVPADAACRTMKVSRSEVYAWRHLETNPTGRKLPNAELGDPVAKIHDQRFGTYGLGKRDGRAERGSCAPTASSSAGSMALANPPIIAALRSIRTRALPATEGSAP